MRPRDRFAKGEGNSIFIILILLAISLILLSFFPFLGIAEIKLDSIFSEGYFSEIFWKIRFPRAAGAFLAGAILAICGMAFQSMFKNDLATPYTLGISSGSALGSVIAVKFFTDSLFSALPLSQIFSFAGAAATVLLIFFATNFKKRAGMEFLLLAGVAINFTCSGLILFIQYLADGAESSMMIRLMMGSLDFVGFSPVLKMLPAFLLLFFTTLFLHRELDLMRINSEIAITRGVNLQLVENIIFFSVSFSVAIVVSQVGPIGFIGMTAPHIAKKFVGAEHRFLIFASLLVGGITLLISDTFARIVIAPAEIPVGVVTSFFGGPFFLFILLKKRKEP